MLKSIVDDGIVTISSYDCARVPYRLKPIKHSIYDLSEVFLPAHQFEIGRVCKSAKFQQTIEKMDIIQTNEIYTF